LNAVPSDAVATLTVSIIEIVLAPVFVMKRSFASTPNETPWLPASGAMWIVITIFFVARIDLLHSSASVARDISEFLIGCDRDLDGPGSVGISAMTFNAFASMTATLFALQQAT
jgi:hypothetical protein